MMSELSQLMNQLKLPIGYNGRSFEDAVRDLDAIINRLIDREQQHDWLVEAVRDVATERNEFSGNSLDYMQGYRDGQQYLQARLIESLDAINAAQ